VDSSTEQAPPHAPFCVTLVDFSPAQASDFEDALRQTADSLQIAVRCERSVSDASYPAAVIHAIGVTPKAIAQVSGGNMVLSDPLRTLEHAASISQMRRGCLHRLKGVALTNSFSERKLTGTPRLRRRLSPSSEKPIISIGAARRSLFAT